jgi:hypothetical protein
MAVCFKENQRLLSHFLRMWWKYEKTSFSAVSAYTFAPTVIGLGEVKVDLADFELKLQENLLSNLIFF